jgi:hypothetical protein
MFFAHGAADLQVAADVVLLKDHLELQIDLGGASQSRFRADEPRA